jgi:DNA invertase Pin-like site-specific DNA recombinase
VSNMTSMTLDGYIRVSQTRGREGDSFISPRVQRDAIQAWADARHVKIAAWHEDLDQSGGKLHRPGLDGMLERIGTGQTGGLAVAHLDRLSRAGVADALRLVEGVHRAGAKIAVVDLGIDPTTPVGEFSMTLFLALGRMQRRQFEQRWDEARGRAIGRGIHFRAPFGYTKPAKGQPIVPNPETASLVERVFELRAAGESWPRLAAFLNERHPPNRAPSWTHSTVIQLVRNRAYLGEASHGEHVQAGAHPALVSAELWDAANAVKGRAPGRGEGTGTLLAGLVRCAGCRRVMSPGVTQGGGRTERLLTYRCRRNHGAGRCQAASAIKRETIESYVENAFLERYSDVSVEGVTDNADLEAAQLEVHEAEANLEAFRDNERVRVALSPLGDSSFEDGITARVDKVITARERLAAARASAVGFVVPDVLTYAALTVPERRGLLRAGIGAVFVRRSTVHGGRGGAPDPAERVMICWAGEEPDDLPGRHTQATPTPVSFDW